MGFIVAMSLFVIWLFEREASLLIASALFYIGSHIGCVSNSIDDYNKNAQK
jgi:hypothetical protein